MHILDELKKKKRKYFTQRMAIGDKLNAVCMQNHCGAVESKESSAVD